MQFQPPARSVKKARNITISIVVLLVLIVGGGVAYTYFFGPDNSKLAAVSTPPPPPAPLIKAHTVDPRSPIGVSIQTLSSPVAPGDNALLTAKTLPGATCKITVAYAGVASKDSGLAPKKADEFGTATWSWTIEPTAALGSWPVHLNCALGAKWAVVDGNLVVAKTQPAQ